MRVSVLWVGVGAGLEGSQVPRFLDLCSLVWVLSVIIKAAIVLFRVSKVGNSGTQFLRRGEESRKSPGTSPNHESGRGVLFSYSFLALNQQFRSARTSLFHALISQTSPGTASAGEILQKNLEKRLSSGHNTALARRLERENRSE